jgi:hypothetical protein
MPSEWIHATLPGAPSFRFEGRGFLTFEGDSAHLQLVEDRRVAWPRT